MKNLKIAMLPLMALIMANDPANGPVQEKEAAPAPMPAVDRFQFGDWIVSLRKDSQTLVRLSPASDKAFDFEPSDREGARSGNGYVHLGDLHIRLRTEAGDWHDFSSAKTRVPVQPLETGDDVFAAADMTATMGQGFPLRIMRQWEQEGDDIVLRFDLHNDRDDPVEIGALGMPMVFDNIITGRDLEEAHAKASFVDPNIGRDGGYLQVTRLNGHGPALLVLPERNTALEAYVPIFNPREAKNSIFTDRTQRSQTFEGFYDWMVASKAMAGREWAKGGRPWNTPTSFVIAPHSSRSIAIRFAQSPSIRSIEQVLAAKQRPVVVGVPGYVVPTDLDAALYVKSPSPIRDISVFPADAMTVKQSGVINGWDRLSVRGTGWGRARLSIRYANGQTQTVSYYVTKPLGQVVADLGHFATTKQFFNDKNDPFHRGPGILSYDHEAGKILTQEPRVWISGMSDEGGAGSWVAAMSKQLDNPDPAEVAKLERVVNETVWGHLQVRSGNEAGGVKKSLFYYDPKEFPNYYDKNIDWSSWMSWSKKDAGDLGRTYNYPHVAIGYWTLYRLARDHQGLVTMRDWRWYLEHAWITSMSMVKLAPYYAQFGLMEGNVFVDILDDLKREGMTKEAAEMEAAMKARADHWSSLAYPFGSEMAWDSTGQPEVYAWLRYFGYQKQADETREVIVGYDPTIPGWGYNGNVRRYWDFLYGGKYPRIERQIHHYGSTLNAVPLFDAYRANPADIHLLRAAYGGLMGGITNIDRDGFGSAAFHSYPDKMRWDPYTGDYGMGFFGHAYASATYLLRHPDFGWISFGGNLSQKDGRVAVVPKDSARTRFFVAPVALWMTLDAGKFSEVSYGPGDGSVTVSLDRATAHTDHALLCLETTVSGQAAYQLRDATLERGCYRIALSNEQTVVRLTRD